MMLVSREGFQGGCFVPADHLATLPFVQVSVHTSLRTTYANETDPVYELHIRV